MNHSPLWFLADLKMPYKFIGSNHAGKSKIIIQNLWDKNKCTYLN